MPLRLTRLLDPQALQTVRAALGDSATWVDGATSAGTQAQAVKHNRQLAQDSDTSRQLQALVLGALQRDALFLSAALPRRILPPLFNRYRAHGDGTGEHYGAHIDNAVMRAGTGAREGWLRSDLSCTLFLSDPSTYDGGELVLHGALGAQRIKLDAGDALLYPASSLHEVTPVTRGERLASFFWIESMVRSSEQRRLLFDLDMNLLALRTRHGESAETTALSGVYHNLLRQWAHT